VEVEEMSQAFKTIRHWTPEDKPAGFIRCTGLVDERTLDPQASLSGYPHGPYYLHQTTRNRLAVNCEVCRGNLPEVIALRRGHAETGTQVVAALAAFGISASYEDRKAPMVSMHVDTAVRLLGLLAVPGE
jgi:hypothetical protein